MKAAIFHQCGGVSQIQNVEQNGPDPQPLPTLRQAQGKHGKGSLLPLRSGRVEEVV
jgi:hypothetical protein